MTLQIGSGAAIAAETGITTVSDFRAMNIALGGQGAPLVPAGDELLFGDYAACINIGGFANISLPSLKGRQAFDICPANIVLNYLSNKIGLPFDPSGSIAAGGKLNEELLHELNNLDYYNQPAPKSLGKEWVEQNVIPLLDRTELSSNDLLCTFTHHIATQISKNLPSLDNSKALFTGGGSHNSYLINLLKEKSGCEIVVPSSKVVDFKEALIFGLLGVLRLEGMTNCYAVATGARIDCSSGALHLPPKIRAK
jgi:anhydro-N-acetylmuramic acid kinase